MKTHEPERKAHLKAALHLLKPHLPGLSAVVLLSLVAGLLGGAGDPFFLKMLIDTLGSGDTRRFLLLAGGLLVLYTVMRLLNHFATILTVRIKNRICERKSLEQFGRFYRIPFPLVRDREDGYHVSRIYDEPAQVTGVVDIATKTVAGGATLLGALAICLWLSWEITLVLSAVVPILLYLARRFGKKIRKTTEEEVENEARLREGLGRAVRSYRTVRLFDLEDTVQRRTHGLLGDYLGALYERSRLSSLFQTLSSISLSYAEMAVLLGCGFQVLQGNLTIGGLFAFTSAFWRVVNTYRGLLALIPAYAKIQAQMDRIRAFEDMGEEETSTVASSTVALNGISLGFAETPVLKDFDLSLQKGERLLLVGANGTGKSTLAHLLSGFLKPSFGEARLPGRDRVSAFLLPCCFAPGSVRDNVQFDRLTEAQQRSFQHMMEVFRLDAKLDEDPEQFSEGEKRKLQLAMTLLKDADYYILDEPFANLDVESVDMVMETILEATEGRGLMVIMHGFEHLADRFDRTLRLEPANSLAA
jgi:ABC-type multidrug transport system fused ATPase/permease subunit